MWLSYVFVQLGMIKIWVIVVSLEVRPFRILTRNLSSLQINQIKLPIEPNNHSVIS